MMNNQRLFNWLAVLGSHLRDLFRPRAPARPDLHTAWQHQADLPDFVTACPVAQRYLKLLGPLAWDQLPERDLQRNWGQTTIP